MYWFAPVCHISLRRCINIWLLLIVTITALPSQARVHAQASNALVAYPSTVAPGAEMRIAGYGFPGRDGFNVLLESQADAVPLGQATATLDGQILPTMMVLPDGLTPGDYAVVLRNGGGTSVARAALTVRAAPTITLSATSGAPGMQVEIHVEGLVVGTLRVLIGDATVLGPLPVQGATYDGRFVVPDGQQLGELMVTAINTVDGVRVGQADGRFTLQAATAARYTLRDIVAPTEEVKPGNQFVVSGRIDPVPTTIDLPGYQVLALWQSDGQLFPINLAPASINPDGSFALSAQVPSLLKGDAISPKNGDQMQVVVVAPGNVALPASKASRELNLHVPSALRFEAIKPDGTTIPNTPKVAGQPDPLRVVFAPLGNIFWLKKNDLSNLAIAKQGLDISALWDSPSDQQIARQAKNISICWGRKFISKVPEREWYEFEWAGNAEQALFAANPGVDNDGLPSVARIGQIGAIGPMARATQGIRTMSTQAEDLVGARVFEVIIDASRVVDGAQRGYGFIENGDVAKPFVGRYMYVPEMDKLFRLDDANGRTLTLMTGTVKIEMPPLPVNWRTELKVLKVVARTPGTDGKEVNGNIYTFVDQLNGAPPDGIRVNVPQGSDKLEFRAYVIPPSTGVPTSEFTIDYGSGPVSLGPGHADVERATDSDCGSTGNPPRDYYSVTLPDAADRIPPGDHVVKFTLGDEVITDNKTLVLHYAAPPAWIKDNAYLNRTADWSVFSTTLRADRFNEGNATVNLPQVKAKEISNKPDGAVDNSSGGNLSVLQVLGPTGFGSIVTSGKTRTTAINNPRDEPFAKPNAFGNQTTFGTGEKTQKIFDTGWLLIFETVWGLPPIASATFSIKTRVEAELKYNGTITRDAQGSISQVQLDLNPSATVHVDGGVDASALADFVEASVHFLPSIGVNMPVSLVNGSIDSLRACFHYELRARVYGSIGWEPFEKGFNSTKTILPYSEVCAKALAAQARAEQLGQADADVWELPRARPAIATDGFGTILSLWRDTNGDLVYRLGTDGLPQPLPGAQRGAQMPQITFYAPNRAIAAWTETAMTPDEVATLSFEDALKRQHLVWSRWNGSGWDAPQRLTQPTTGDGSVALAGCIFERDAACPVGGAITAAWTHDAVGDLPARNFRVYFASYRGTDDTWSGAQPVDDTADVTDHEALPMSH